MKSIIKLVSNVKLTLNLNIVSRFDHGIKTKIVFNISYQPEKSVDLKPLLVTNLSSVNNQKNFFDLIPNVKRTHTTK